MIFCCKGKWHYRDGYGFEIAGEDENKSSQILILKLHGSCNWTPYLNVDYLNIICPHKSEFSTSKNSWDTSDYGEALINPSYHKNPFELPVLKNLWNQAQNKIEEADEIFVIGYSLPEADKHAEDMFSQALKRSSINEIKFVGGSAYSRWENFGASLEKRVIKIGNRFEDFVDNYSTEIA